MRPPERGLNPGSIRKTKVEGNRCLQEAYSLLDSVYLKRLFWENFCETEKCALPPKESMQNPWDL